MGKKRAILLGPIVKNQVELKRVLKKLDIRENDFLIGVDGGVAHWVCAGYTPDLGVGDWDSLRTKRILKEIPHVTLSQSKDRSDLYFSLKAALEFGAQELICLGVTGDRPDHHLAVILDLFEFARGVHGPIGGVRVLSADADYLFLTESLPTQKMLLKKGQLVSIFAMNGTAKGLRLLGFKYPLVDGVLTPSSHGLSNLAVKRNCEVSLRKGQVLVIMPHKWG